MSVSVNKYVDLLSRYGIYGENGYYVDSHIIHRMIVDELKLHLSFSGIEEFVNTCGISITESEIKDFLDKKMDEEEPTLRKKLEKPSKPISNNPLEWTEEDIHREARAFETAILKGRYRFEPYSLQYFKTYTSILKEKCKTLFEILEDLAKVKEGTISKEGWDRIVDLDFHINEYGDIYITDVERLADAIIYNVKDLYDKITKGNNPETYLTFKESKHNMARDGIFESEIYPRKEVQIKDLYYGHCKEFIALSENQEEKLEQERFETISKVMEEDFLDDNNLQDNHTLVKTRKNNNKLKS